MDDEARPSPSEPDARLHARREVIATVVIVGALVALAIGRPVARRLARHPSRERCAAMLDRYAGQVARAYERAPGPAPVAAVDVGRCTRELTDDEVECALHASYADAIERCLPP
jgi:hypothetical protein